MAAAASGPSAAAGLTSESITQGMETAHKKQEAIKQLAELEFKIRYFLPEWQRAQAKGVYEELSKRISGLLAIEGGLKVIFENIAYYAETANEASADADRRMTHLGSQGLDSILDDGWPVKLASQMQAVRKAYIKSMLGIFQRITETNEWLQKRELDKR